MAMILCEVFSYIQIHYSACTEFGVHSIVIYYFSLQFLEEFKLLFFLFKFVPILSTICANKNVKAREKYSIYS